MEHIDGDALIEPSKDAAEGQPSHRAFRSLVNPPWRKIRGIQVVFILTYVVAFLAALYFFHTGTLHAENIVNKLRGHPILAPLLFALIYALMVTMLLPTLPLNLAAGFLWGPIWGTMLSVIAVSIAAAASFTVSRHIASDFVRRRIKKRAWRWVRWGLRTSNWRTVAFSRINPIFPFGPMNYVFGLTSIRFWPYILATAIFIIPPSFLIALLGYSTGAIILDARAENILENLLLASAAISTIIATPYFLLNHLRNRRRISKHRAEKDK